MAGDDEAKWLINDGPRNERKRLSAQYDHRVKAAKLLKDLRRRAGLTQAEVARRVGIPSTVVSAYERGRREPSFDVVRRLVGAMGFAIHVDGRLDPAVQARKLADVLLLAEQLPYHPKPLATARLR